MRISKKFAGVLGATALASASIMTLTGSPATAYTGQHNINCVAFGNNAPWDANFSVNFSPANPQAGDTVTVTVGFDQGPENGAPFELASNLVVPTGSISLSGAATGTVALSGPALIGATPQYELMPAGSVSGTFVASTGLTTARLTGISFGASGANIPCDATTTTIAETLAISGATGAISGINRQAVTTHARSGDTISFDVTGFITDGAATAQICDTDGTNCVGTASSLTIAAGDGAGTLVVPTAAAAGNRAIKIASGAESTLLPIKILSAATLSSTLSGGGAGTEVTLTGTNFDPGQQVVITGTSPATGFPPIPVNTTDSKTVTASATGTINTTFTVNDPATTKIQATQPHRATPAEGVIAVTPSVPFAFSADACVAKLNDSAPVTDSCEVVQTVALTVTSGPLSMEQSAGSITMDAITLDGTDQVSTGAINDITVSDQRNGTLGWTLNAEFSGMNGGTPIPASALEMNDIACDNGANNTNTVIEAGDTRFVDASTAITVCSVDDTVLPVTVSGDTTANAGLALDVASNTAPGGYAGTLTFTLQ